MRCLLPVAVVATLLTSSTALAVIGQTDRVPAATLLIPYFEVDVDSPTGVDTVFTIQAATASAALTNVVVWSDLGVPVLRFNVYLTGFDTQIISLREILSSGALPQTASVGQDPSNTISPQGVFSQDINYASCAGALPPAALPAGIVADTRAALRGDSSVAAGGCVGLPHADEKLRGYVTVDYATACSNLLPTQAGYFVNGGGGIAGNQNYLTGDFYIVDVGRGITLADSAAHIEAASAVTGADTPSFYARLVAFDAIDNREPLSSSWGVPFTQGETELFVWRDPQVTPAAFSCGGRPGFYPLTTTGLFGFDEQEVATVAGPDFLAERLGAVAGRYLVDSDNFPVASPTGWLWMNLFHTEGSAPVGMGGQGYVFSMQRIEHNTGLPGIAVTGPGVAVDDPRTLENASQSPVSAENLNIRPIAVGSTGNAPGSTLLVPYFEVDLEDPNQADTIIRFRDMSPSAALARVTLWTDLGVPTVSFNTYLTGLDESVLRLGRLFRDGFVEATGDDADDLRDFISNQGEWSQDINFPGVCQSQNLTAATVAHIRAAHTGQFSSVLGGCAATPRTDNIARGFITIDSVTVCAAGLPSALDSTASVFDTRRLLAGEFLFFNRADRVVYEGQLAAIEASATEAQTAAGQATFYGFLNAHAGVDNREPLPNQWTVRYLNGLTQYREIATGGTELLVWRDPGAVVAPFACGGALPAPFPLSHAEARVFDLESRGTQITTPNMFPIASQRVAVTSLLLPVTAGTLFVDLSAASATGQPTERPGYRGAYIVALSGDTSTSLSQSTATQAIMHANTATEQ
ncbi:MAG: hypothetical protein ACAI38_04000 [Myxococcota bacterium]